MGGRVSIGVALAAVAAASGFAPAAEPAAGTALQAIRLHNLRTSPPQPLAGFAFSASATVEGPAVTIVCAAAIDGGRVFLGTGTLRSRRAECTWRIPGLAHGKILYGFVGVGAYEGVAHLRVIRRVL